MDSCINQCSQKNMPESVNTEFIKVSIRKIQLKSAVEVFNPPGQLVSTQRSD